MLVRRADHRRGGPAAHRGGIVGEGGRLVIIGTLLGLTASIGLGRVIAPLLFQVRAIDPLTLGSVVVLVLVVTLTPDRVGRPPRLQIQARGGGSGRGAFSQFDS